MMNGLIVKGIGGFYYVMTPEGTVYECRAAGLFRKDGETPLPGDRVEMNVISEEQKTGSVAAILPRKNRLVRPKVANVDQIFLVFSALRPSPNFIELNRYLVSVGDDETDVALVVTKTDLAEEKEREAIREAFHNALYPIYMTSSVTGEGLSELKEALKDSVTVFSGPSGVGKSSLLNAIAGKKHMEVGGLSKKIERGKNTTRHTEIFFAENNAVIFDTPGFTSVDVGRIKLENLILYYPEMVDLSTKCRYPSCSHLTLQSLRRY